MTREIMVSKVIARYGFESTETIEFCTYVEKYENYSGYLADYMLKTLFESLMKKPLDN